jgi:hypothetical protein
MAIVGRAIDTRVAKEVPSKRGERCDVILATIEVDPRIGFLPIVPAIDMTGKTNE